MTRTNLLGSQVKRLLSSLSDHGNQHLTEVETDLVQTTFLLSEAIGKLGASFMSIHEAASAQQQSVDALLAGATPTVEMAEQLKGIQSEIERHVSAAVTGLQFQDMTNQLIGRTVQRVAGLRDVLGAVGSSGSTIQPETDEKEIAALLDDLSNALEDQSTKLEGLLWKAVSQTHMESGDIELF